MQDITLTTLYAYLDPEVPQVVAGRWRALTRHYSKERLYNGRDIADGFIHQLAGRIADILIVAGAAITVDDLHSMVGHELESIVRLSLSLQQVLGEDIVTSDYDLLHVPAGTLFDSSEMDNRFPEDEVQPKAVVLCTTGLGLRRSVRADGEEAGLDIATVLNPEVVVEEWIMHLGLVDEHDDTQALAEYDVQVSNTSALSVA